MRSLRLILLATAATSSLVSAQGLNDLPTCVLGPAVSALASTGCEVTDYKCLCSSSSFIAALQKAASTACSPMDLENAEKFATTLCASVGITLSVGGSSTSSSSTPTPTSSSSVVSKSSSSSVYTTVPTTTAVVEAVSTVYVTVPCSTSGATYTSSVVTTPASNVTSTKTAAPSKFTGAAAASYTYSVFGGVLAFAVAVLL